MGANMKKILIAGYPSKTGNYSSAMENLGVLVSVTTLPQEPEGYDGLLLPGGDDIDPALFHETNHGSRLIDPILDRQQLFLLDLFIKAGKPILGICKGMQLINVYFGGGIVQDLPGKAIHQYDQHDQVHPSLAVPGCVLHRLYGPSFNVNSAHHQGVGTPGRELSIIQYAHDGVAEGLSHTCLPVLGLQWHPERMCFAHARSDTVDGSKILRFFTEEML